MAKSRREGRRGTGETRASGRSDAHATNSYFDRSRRPLEILALVAPLVVLYEVGLVSAQRSAQGTLTNAAHEGLFRFFWSFGIDAERMSLPALALPAVAVVLILILWQMIARRPWSLHLPTVGAMVIESALLAIPLLVLAEVISRAAIPAIGWSALPAVAAGAPDEAIAKLTPFARVTMSIGAGIYEELVFRMVLLALLHGLLVDLLRMDERWGATIAIVVSAVLFAVYHPIHTPTGGVAWPRLAFFLLAGLYFGTIYSVRGFGIAVGAHSAYDIAVFALLAES